MNETPLEYVTIRPYRGAPLAEYQDGRLVLHLEAGYHVRIDGVECVVVSVGVSEITTRPVTDADEVPS